MSKLTIAIVFLSLILSSCSPTYTALTGTHQAKPFEVQVNSNFDKSWATVEKIFTDEEMPIFWKDKSSGVITSDLISFRQSFAVENEDGTVDDPSSRVVVSRVKDGISALEPDDIRGKWHVRVRSISDNVSMINIELRSPRASKVVNGVKTNFDIRSTGAFEKFVYASLHGKSVDELKTNNKPMPTEVKKEIAPPPPPAKKKEMAVEDAKEVMAKESPIVGKPEQPKSAPIETQRVQKSVAKEMAEATPKTNIKSSTTMATKKVDVPSANTTSANTANVAGAKISQLENQVAVQKQVIQKQRSEIDMLKNQATTTSLSNQSTRSYSSAASTTTNPSGNENITIQFIALTDSNRQFDHMKDLGKLVIEKVPNKNVYRYKLGYFSSKLEANRALAIVKIRGYKDAFLN